MGQKQSSQGLLCKEHPFETRTDVSRWGRFQDADESAYYEYICRRAEIAVHYCGEQFENDGSPISTIVKGVKRAMAGEYSRELSAKVFIGQCRLIELGFRQGGSAGYGLRRMLRDVSGADKGMLGHGEQKSIQTDRVYLVPGPTEEVETVARIYRLFVDGKQTESEIAAVLNKDGFKTDLGRAWTRGVVHQILTNEKYIGNNVYNRVSFKLKKKRVQNLPEMWIRRNDAFEPLVPLELFAQTQLIIHERCRRFSNDELLAQLRDLLDREGRISGLLIDETESMASSSVFRSRFNSLIAAYTLIGYVNGILHLLDHGEDRLLSAVERGRVPVSVAMAISTSDEAGIQRMLCDAYEDKSLRGRKLQTVRRVIRDRAANGKKFRIGMRSKEPAVSSAESLVKVYQREADRQKLVVKKARLTETRLLFLVSAIKKLFRDEDFVTLLRAEGLDTLLAYLAEKIQNGGKR